MNASLLEVILTLSGAFWDSKQDLDAYCEYSLYWPYIPGPGVYLKIEELLAALSAGGSSVSGGIFQLDRHDAWTLETTCSGNSLVRRLASDSGWASSELARLKDELENRWIAIHSFELTTYQPVRSLVSGAPFPVAGYDPFSGS